MSRRRRRALERSVSPEVAPLVFACADCGVEAAFAMGVREAEGMPRAELDAALRRAGWFLARRVRRGVEAIAPCCEKHAATRPEEPPVGDRIFLACGADGCDALTTAPIGEEPRTGIAIATLAHDLQDVGWNLAAAELGPGGPRGFDPVCPRCQAAIVAHLCERTQDPGIRASLARLLVTAGSD